MDARFNAVDARFNGVDGRLDRMLADMTMFYRALGEHGADRDDEEENGELS